MKLAGVLAVVLLVASSAAAGRGAPSVSVAGGIVSPGDRIVVQVSGATPAQRLQLYLRRYPASGRPVAIGNVVPDGRGRARLAFRLPRLAADLYLLAACCASGNLVTGHGVLSVRALPPAGFGALGAPGCEPASPLNRNGTGFSRYESFGTAAGVQLWGLFAFYPAGAALVGDTVTYDGVVGKEVKIVFRRTSGVPTNFYAVAPDGSRVAPSWGPSGHLGSNWNRPGSEWGAGFVFTQPGCWQIHAGSPPAQGDLWLSIRS